MTILEYERNLTRQLGIFIDLSRESLRGLGRQSTVEVAVRVAAAVAGQTLNAGGRVYIRFDHGLEPLGMQWYRRIRQLFLSRFHV